MFYFLLCAKIHCPAPISSHCWEPHNPVSTLSDSSTSSDLPPVLNSHLFILLYLLSVPNLLLYKQCPTLQAVTLG